MNPEVQQIETEAKKFAGEAVQTAKPALQAAQSAVVTEYRTHPSVVYLVISLIVNATLFTILFTR